MPGVRDPQPPYFASACVSARSAQDASRMEAVSHSTKGDSSETIFDFSATSTSAAPSREEQLPGWLSDHLIPVNATAPDCR